MSENNDGKINPIEKTIRILIIVTLAIVLLLVAVKVGEKLVFAKFYNNAKRELPIPGIGRKFVGQGLDYIEEEGVFITCGYSSKKGEPSMVYIMYPNGCSEKTELKNEDGSNYTGHTGGIAHYNGFCYITGEDGCDIFTLADVLAGGEAKKIGEIKSPEGHDPAFVTIRGGKLYEGSFYRAVNYETPENERITTPHGDENKAVIYVYDLNDAEPFCVNQTPVAAYSIPGLVQGMEFAEDNIVLSASYGFACSSLMFYDMKKIAEPVRTAVGDNLLDVYYLDGSCLNRRLKIPPMSEEIVYKDGRLFIMCESASDKYIFGKFMSGKYMYSYKV